MKFLKIVLPLIIIGAVSSTLICHTQRNNHPNASCLDRLRAYIGLATASRPTK